MLINVRVVPGASRTGVSEENGLFKVRLTRPAREGEANGQLIEVLAEHFNTKKYRVTIRRGHNSRNKQVEILDGA